MRVTSREPMRIAPEVKGGGFAAPGRADNDEQFAVIDRQGEFAHGRRGRAAAEQAAVSFADVLENNLRHAFV
jgi:hypothetical protein